MSVITNSSVGRTGASTRWLSASSRSRSSAASARASASVLGGPATLAADRQQHPDSEGEQQHGDAQGDGREQVLDVHSDRPYRAPLMSLRTRSQRSRIADSAPRSVGR